MSLPENAPEAHELDLRGVPCPLNFVKVKLLLDKVVDGALVRVRLDNGEPLDSVRESLRAEGHEVVAVDNTASSYSCLSIRKHSRR